MKTKKNISVERQVTVDGVMTFGELETGLRTMDFQCYDDVEVKPVRGRFYVQAMRDGNVYMEQMPKRKHNKPIFRDDNCSLSHGKDGRYYFYFSLPEQLVDELPKELVRQASAIAQKVIKEIITKKGGRR